MDYHCEILAFIKWSYRTTPYIMLSIELRIIIIFLSAHSKKINTRVVLVFVLEAASNHVPLEYKCSNKISNPTQGS